jgi:uncharacterized protein (TIGR02172 family)
MRQGRLIGRGRTAEIFEWGEGQILKLYLPGWNSAIAEIEARLARQVYATGLNVPAVGEVVQVEGRTGVVYERVVGESLLWHLSTQPWRVLAFARLLAELHAQMRRCTAPELPSLRERLEKKIRAADPLSPELRERALAALRQLPDGNALCHGDFHPDNILMTSRGPIIIDWLDAARGHPLADVARSSLLFRLGEIPPGTRGRALIELIRSWFQAEYLRHYRQLCSVRQEEIDAWGLPVAAGRLSEGIAGEEKQLIALVRKRKA